MALHPDRPSMNGPQRLVQGCHLAGNIRFPRSIDGRHPRFPQANRGNGYRLPAKLDHGRARRRGKPGEQEGRPCDVPANGDESRRCARMSMTM